MKPTTLDAYNLFHQGALALAEVEAAGIRIDVDRLDQTIAEVDATIDDLYKQLQQDEVWTAWKKRCGKEANMGSRFQMAKVLFQDLGYKPKKLTPTGRPCMDEEALSQIDLPFVKTYVRNEKLKKLRTTYLSGIRREVVDGYLHVFFNLNLARTYRSCVAKGTLIEVVRDVSKYPKGIPIEKVKRGDYVYCYDESLKLVIRKVLWAGKTGHKKTIRLHWSARGKKGYLDVTPEHKIRMASGRYVRADSIEGGDFRSPSANKRSPKTHVLALGRVRDRLFVTGSKTMLDHVLVYKQLVGVVRRGNVIHHRDGNHLNNKPKNLCLMSLSEHASYHQNFTEEDRKKGLSVRMEKHRQGDLKWRTGSDCWNWLEVSKYSFLKMLARAKGRPTMLPHTFAVMKRKAQILGVDLKSVGSRYGSDGKYISCGRLVLAMELGISQAQRELKIGYYTLKALCEYRSMEFARKSWGNQYGNYLTNNHKILRVEALDQEVDVYDIEVEECHNFIANEICVHNSSDSINLQNIPCLSL